MSRATARGRSPQPTHASQAACRRAAPSTHVTLTPVRRVSTRALARSADGNGYIDATELKAILTRPGTGTAAMGDEEAEVILMILTELFDANSDGKLSVAEVCTAISNQYTGF